MMSTHLHWIVACGVLLVWAGAAPAGEYVWKDGKWVPAAKPAEGTAAGELALVRRYVEQGARKKAVKAAERLLDKYSGDPACEEAMLLAGQAELNAGRYLQAYERFEKQLDEYPNGRYVERALTREVDVAEAFLAGKKKIVLKVFRMPATQDGLDILNRIAEHAPGSVIAERALLRVGEYYEGVGKHAEAAEAYDHFLEMFPKSARAPEAMLKGARATYASFKGIAYDETPLIEAEQRFRVLMEQYPIAAKKVNAAQVLKQITAARARKVYETARFYERTNRPKSARFYYRQVIETYPDTKWAAAARRALSGAPAPKRRARPTAAPKPAPAGKPKPKPAPAGKTKATAAPKPTTAPIDLEKLPAASRKGSQKK